MDIHSRQQLFPSHGFFHILLATPSNSSLQRSVTKHFLCQDHLQSFKVLWRQFLFESLNSSLANSCYFSSLSTTSRSKRCGLGIKSLPSVCKALGSNLTSPKKCLITPRLQMIPDCHVNGTAETWTGETVSIPN